MPTAPKRPCSRPGCRHLQPCPEHTPHTAPGQSSAERRASEPWRRLYDTAKWKRLRRRFLATHPLCVLCERAHAPTLATVVDHVMPHRGDETLMWDETNWQALCARHHSSKTIMEGANRR